MWKEVNLLSTNFSAKHTPSATLRKYATHLFTTPLSNVIFDNMMSRLILTLTKQFFDNQFTHFKIKTWKVLYTMQVVKGTIFCCVRSSRRKCYNICYFSHKLWSYTNRILSYTDPGIVKIVLRILKSLNFSKTCQNCKFR